jgi:peptidoglycan/xylan/chitin deacetylase (PgdA/CDA1 family)
MRTETNQLKGFLSIFFLLSVCLGCRQELPHHDGLLPDGYVALTFDDASVNNWYRNLSLLDSLNIKATFYVSKYHTLSPEQKQKLQVIRAHGHEIAYHTTNHPDLRKLLEQKGMDHVMDKEIYADLRMMQADGFVLTDFAYPFGSHTVELDNELLKHFNSVRLLANKNNGMKSLVFQSCKKQLFYGPDIDDNQPKWPDNTTIQKLLVIAGDKRACAIFTGHEINNPNTKLAVSAERLRTIAEWARQNNLQFVTIDKISE